MTSDNARKSFGRLKPLLLRQGSAGAALRLISMITGFASAVVLARGLGAEGLGVYASVLALLTICSLPLEFGLPSLVTREVARHSRDNNYGPVLGLMHFCVRFTALIFVPLALLAWVLISISPWSGELVETPYWWLLLGYIYFNGFVSISAAFLAGIHALVWAQIHSLVISPVLFLLIITAFYWSGTELLTAHSALLVQTICTLVSGITCILVVIRKYAGLLHNVEPESDVKSWFRSTWKLGLVNSIRRSQPQVLLYILSLLASLDAVGYFRIAQRGASLVSFGSSVVTTTAAPYVASLLSENNKPKLGKLVQTATLAMLAWAVVGFLGVAILGQWLLALVFGGQFVAAYWLLLLCCAAEVVKANWGFGFIGLNMAGHEQDSVKFMLVSLLLSLLGTLLLVPIWGAEGCAIAYLSGLVASHMLANSRFRRLTGIGTGIESMMIKTARPNKNA